MAKEDREPIGCQRLTVLDLFSGIGGFSLGLESTGHYRTAAFCEIEPFARKVLHKHWPNIPCYEDVKDVGAGRLAADGIGRVDIVTGGFPCQDISLAGSRAGLSGERSGLWSELFRVITEIRPRWAIIENVLGLRTLGADRVLSDLAGAGYSAWPAVVGAVHAGAPHRRQRVWIIAHAQHGSGRRFESERGPERRDPELAGNGEKGDAADTEDSGRYDWAITEQRGDRAWPAETWESNRQPPGGRYSLATGQEQWDWQRAPQPVLRGVDDGLPCGMDRRKRIAALGNAVVPQVVAAIGRAIGEIESDR